MAGTSGRRRAPVTKATIRQPATMRQPASTGRPDPAAITKFVERFAVMLVESGMARMPARVFATLLASDTGQLTAAELA
jgi:hypothetical protein